jgi:Ca2+-binding RTX toxin-like protein
VLRGGPGNDRFRGQGGNDRIRAKDGRRDEVRGGDGFDWARVDRRLDVTNAIEAFF